VFLPRVEEIRDPTPSPIPLPISHTASGTILLAEDNAEVRELISSALVKSGYQVVSTRDGLDAQRLYDKNRSEIVAVVTDVKPFTAQALLAKLGELLNN
jgi:DNA-binding NtrC family response regulator